MMITMNRLTQVKYVLNCDTRIRDYYFENYWITESMFDEYTCMDYSPDGLGEFTDVILKDGEYLFNCLKS